MKDSHLPFCCERTLTLYPVRSQYKLVFFVFVLGIKCSGMARSMAIEKKSIHKLIKMKQATVCIDTL